MALTAEQQALNDAAMAVEATRHSNQLALLRETTRLDLIRIAKDVLIENARVKPVEEREISASDIIAFTQSLSNYVVET